MSVAIGKYLGLGTLGLACTLSGFAFADDVDRNACLRYDQLENIHQLDSETIMLEVDGGETLYMLTVESRCFGNSVDENIMIEQNGHDGCMRTTDRVSYGRRQCRIESVELIESREALREALARTE